MCVKLRFTCTDNGDQDSTHCIEDHKSGTQIPSFNGNVYKRKSTKTRARDRNRFNNWKVRSSNAKSDRDSNQGSVVTRSMSRSKSACPQEFQEKNKRADCSGNITEIESDRDSKGENDDLIEFRHLHSPLELSLHDTSEKHSPGEPHALDVPVIDTDSSESASEHFAAGLNESAPFSKEMDDLLKDILSNMCTKDHIKEIFNEAFDNRIPQNDT